MTWGRPKAQSSTLIPLRICSKDVPIEPHVRLAADLLLGTGIRVSEACAANVGDVVEIDGRHFVLILVEGRKRRGEERQSVPLGPELARMLQDAVLTREAIDPGPRSSLTGRGGAGHALGSRTRSQQWGD